MKICFIADANSIHARRWIGFFCKPENQIHVLSTQYCSRLIEGAVIHNLPALGTRNVAVDGIGVKGSMSQSESMSQPGLISRVKRVLPSDIEVSSGLVRMAHLYYKVARFAGKAKTIVQRLQPDIVHCLRLPVEGYVGGLVGYRPMAVSTWGEDFIFFARGSRGCRWLTRNAMSKADLFFSDSLRDKYIAEAYGFRASSQTAIMPVTGGLELDKVPLYHKEPLTVQAAKQKLGISPDMNLILSVRGFKAFYINIEPLVKAVPKVVQSYPNTIFVLRGETRSGTGYRLKKLAKSLGVEQSIQFTDRLSAEELTNHFTASDIMVSATLFDGAPVSMMEGMAYGLIPVMSLHSPIQEWVTDGQNGYLFNPQDPESIAQAIIGALKDKGKWEMMRKQNWDMVKERASYQENMARAEEMYRELVMRSASETRR